MADKASGSKRPKKRAIALAGGGPAAGFHMGVLEALEKHNITFDVWSLSCIGAWVGVYYNQCGTVGQPLEGNTGKAATTQAFFRAHAFRDTQSYRGFPVNKAFAPNLEAYAAAWMSHALDPATFRDVFGVANEVPDVAAGWARFMTTPSMWMRAGDRNAHVLNNILAVHPMSRFITSMMYQSGINGLSNIYYEDSTFLDGINIGGLDLLPAPDIDQMTREQLRALVARLDQENPDYPAERKAMPEIYHNAWRLADGEGGPPGQIQLFNNKWAEYWRRGKRTDYLPITRPSLCACSALPYVEQTVRIPNDDNHHYSEGALVDTVNFRNLVEDHPDLDEIWVCRIVDYRQVRLQKNLHDSLGNLCQQFAAEVGENDIELFKTHLRKSVGRTPRVVEIPLRIETKINYRWDHENLDIGCEEGKHAVNELLRRQADLAASDIDAPPWR